MESPVYAQAIITSSHFDQLRSMRLLHDPAFIQSLVSRAVRKGESPLVDLKLTRWPD
jgi:hypothetical protein